MKKLETAGTESCSSFFKSVRVDAESYDKYFVYLPGGERKYFSDLDEMIRWIIEEYFEIPKDEETLVFFENYLHKDLSNFKRIYFVYVSENGEVVATLVEK